VARIEAVRGLYWVILAGTFLGVAVWESFRPKRSLLCPESKRWSCHLILLFCESLLVYAVLRWSGPLLTAAAFADSKYGLLNHASLPLVVRCILAILVLDLTRFATHRAYHAVPILWRVHQVHHSDPDYDVTTSGRFHPLEAVLSVGAEMIVIALMAPPVVGVIAWQLMSTFQGPFVHANATLPPRVEKLMRALFFTPDLHRIHHSAESSDHGSNFGELFPVWDRLFRTYLSAPAAGQAAMRTGLKEFPREHGADLAYLLMLPFRRMTTPSDSEPALDFRDGQIVPVPGEMIHRHK
jgi:sterol desaturase/sphingolipid hydroxylase (fatty acid hydroxylase superfamily)